MCMTLEMYFHAELVQLIVSQSDPVLDPGAVEFRRFTASNFHGVKVVNWPVTPPPNFFRAAAVAFNVQFFDAITEFLMFIY